MKIKVFSLLILFLLAFASCNSDEPNLKGTENELIGQWFRSGPIKVYTGPNQEPEERGDRQVIVSFFEDGTFEYRRTTYGLYAGTTLDDINGYSIDHGVYTVDENNLVIDIHSYTWFDTFYPDTMEETIEYTTNYRWKFLDATFSIDEDELTFIHYTITDIIDPNAERPGYDKYQNTYTRI